MFPCPRVLSRNSTIRNEISDDGPIYCTVPFLRNSPRGADLMVVS